METRYYVVEVGWRGRRGRGRQRERAEIMSYNGHNYLSFIEDIVSNLGVREEKTINKDREERKSKENILM